MSRLRYLSITAGIAVNLVMLTGCSESTAPDENQPVPAPATDVARQEAPAGRLDGSVAPSRYSIELRIDPSQERFSGSVSIDVTIKKPTDAIWLHGKNLLVSEVYLSYGDASRVEASYEERLESGVALLTLQRTVTAGPATLHFTYSAPFNTAMNALFKVVRGNDSYVASQLESTGARQIFPGFDEPAFKVPFSVTVVARDGDVVVTNTPQASSETLADGFVRHVFETTRPLPTYLLAFAVGPYDVVDYGMIPANSIRGRAVPLRGIVARGLGNRMQYALKNTEGLLSILEEYFGTPYPYRKLDLIAMPQSFGGAMENAGAITFDEYLLLMDEDSPLGQRRAYTSVNAHEMSHMWFGDLVTPTWWNDIWLNEAFASWMENKVAKAYWPEGKFDRETLRAALGAMANDSLASARQIREPIESNEQIDTAFDGITYEKGGGVLAMLERYVGEDRFQAGVRLHMKRHADSTATAEDFMASLAEGTERTEIEAAFKSYIEQPGVPLLSVSLDCKDEQNPHLKVRQARYAPLGSAIDPDASQWQVPMCVSFVADGVEKSSCTLLSERQQSIDLAADSCPTRVLPNADGAGYYRFAMDDAGWQSLIDNALSLPPAEALVLADSLDAGFRAGVVPADTYVAGMATLVSHNAWDVADAAITHFENITDIIEDSRLGPVQQAFGRIVGPRFAKLGDASDSGSDLLRRDMQRFLIVVAKDPAMREPLAKQAAARLGLDGDPDVAAAPASQLETIFTVGVQDLGEPFFNLLFQRAIASEDPAFRNAATGALARVEDPRLVRKLQAALLQGRLKGTEFRSVVNRQMVRHATTGLTHDWLQENAEKIIDMMPEFFRARTVASLGGAFCSDEQADEWQLFVLAHADKLPGYERALAQAMENVHLCAALRESRAAELLAALENRE
jgi:aminopeptidase N